MRGETDTHPESERDTKRETETPRDTGGGGQPASQPRGLP